MGKELLIPLAQQGNCGLKWLAAKSTNGYDSVERVGGEEMMTVPELIKLLQQWQGKPAIVSLRIEFGNGSIYENPPNAQQTSQRPTVAVPRGKLAGRPKPDRTSRLR